MKILKLENFARIKEAQIELGDLTIFVGPQGVGKTLVLELIKFLIDKNLILKNLKNFGFIWKNYRELFSLYFGEGLDIVWNENTTKIIKDGKEIDLKKLLQSKRSRKTEKVFYIPAQRVLILGEDGWPKSFYSYRPSDPYVVKKFSEDLRRLLENMKDNLFPIEGRLNKNLRSLIDKSIFWGAKLQKSSKEMKRRLILSLDDYNKNLPFMVWSAGQREFIPLLLGLYWLMPSGKKSKRKGIDFVIIEEPEMGLHPKALETIMILILELLRRNYKVIISTHSPQFLEMIWVLNTLKTSLVSKPEQYLEKLFNAKLTNIWKSTVDMQRQYKVFYFKPDNNKVIVKDISSLDAFAEEDISDWGGLTSFPSRASEIVSEIISESQSEI
jgi:predicted ATP-dependent endonuclease of OLD family